MTMMMVKSRKLFQKRNNKGKTPHTKNLSNKKEDLTNEWEQIQPFVMHFLDNYHNRFSAIA